MNQLKDKLDQKEKYLLQNIQQIDLQAFSEFCKVQKGNLNINEWTYQETIQLADKFKIFKQFDFSLQSTTNHPTQNKDFKLQSNNNNCSQFSAMQLLDLINMPIQEKKIQEQKLKMNIQQNKNPIILIQQQSKISLKNSFKNQGTLQVSSTKPKSLQKKQQKQKNLQNIKIIPCRKQSRSMINKFQNISIKKHQIVHRTFFLPDYVMYHIEVQPSNKICKRNYQDFSRLKTQLMKNYPAVKIPLLQSNSWLSETNIDFIKKQKCSLQFFLNQLIRHPVLSKSQIVRQFLQNQDHKTIKRKFQDYQKSTSPKCLSQLINFDGQVRLSVQNTQGHQIHTLKQLLQKLKQFVSQYYQVSYQISQNYGIILSKMEQMTKLVQNMKQTTQNITQKLNYKSSLQQFPKSLKNLQQTLLYEYKNLSLKKQLYSQKYLQFLKYQQKNMKEYDSILLLRQNLCANLVSLVQKQSVSPSTIYTKKNDQLLTYLNLKKENEILQTSQNFLVCGYNLRYINQMVHQQLNWIFQGFGKELNQRCQQYKRWYLNQHQKLQNNLKVITQKNY